MNKILTSRQAFYLRVLTYNFPGCSDGKASVYNVGDLGSIPRSGRSPGEGNGNPVQYSCLENPMDGGAWWATVHGVAKSWTRLSDFTFTFTFKDSSLSRKVKLITRNMYLCKRKNLSGRGKYIYYIIKAVDQPL